VPATIRSYIAEVQTQLSTVTDWPEAGISNEEKLAFFRCGVLLMGWGVVRVGWIAGVRLAAVVAVVVDALLQVLNAVGDWL